MGHLPSAPEVLRYIKAKNIPHDGSGQDLFIPPRNIKPHLHVTKDFVVFSTSDTNHKDLVRGGADYPRRLSELVLDGDDTYKNLRNVLNWMATEASVKKPNVTAAKPGSSTAAPVAAKGDAGKKKKTNFKNKR